MSLSFNLCDPLEELKTMDVVGMKRCVKMKDFEFIDWLRSLGIGLSDKINNIKSPSVDVLYWLHRDPILKPKQIFLLSFLWAKGQHLIKPIHQIMPIHDQTGTIVDNDHLSEWLQRFSSICNEWHQQMPLQLRAKGAAKKFAAEYAWRTEFGPTECFYHLWAQVLYFANLD